jgi:hypothetical protein
MHVAASRKLRSPQATGFYLSTNLKLEIGFRLGNIWSQGEELNRSPAHVLSHDQLPG